VPSARNLRDQKLRVCLLNALFSDRSALNQLVRRSISFEMQKRIEAAKQLLSETEVPIAQIALKIGFQSQSRFTTLFLQLTGITPRAYRGKNAFLGSSHRVSEGARLPGAAERYLRVA